MAQRTSDNGGNENLRAGEQRAASMEANVRETISADRVFHQNASVTHANAGVQMLDLDSENAEAEASDSGSMMLAQATPTQGAVASVGPVGGKAIGTIQLVVGDVKIMGLDGVMRVAQVGDKVYFKDTILTGTDGIIQIRLDNGQLVDVGRDSKLALDTDFFGYDAGTGLHAAAPASVTAGTAAVEPATKPVAPMLSNEEIAARIARGEDPAQFAPATAAGGAPGAPTQDISALQSAIARGQDPSLIAPATAAGGAPAAGGVGAEGGGGSPVVVDQANTFGPVTAGFQTIGASITFPTPEFNLQPEQEGPPAISVAKTGPATVAEGGASVTWHVQITNNSGSSDPVTLTSVVDDQLGDITAAVIAANGGNPVILAAGATFEFDFSPAGDVDLVLNGGQTHTNVVTVDGTDDEGEQVTGADDHTVTGADVAPAVTIVKTGVTQIAEGGADVTWSFTITNNSVATDPVTVTALGDDQLGNLLAAAEAVNGGPIVLAAGASFSFDYNPEGVLVLDGNQAHTNVVSVTAVDDEGSTATDTDDHTITSTNVAPAVHIEKSSATASVNEGEATQVTYTYTLTNTSTVGTDPLQVVSLTDDNGTAGNAADDFNVLALGSVVMSGGDQDNLLEQGETWTYSVTRNVTLQEGTNSLTNLAIVTATDNEGTQVSDDDDHTVTRDDVPHARELAIAVDEDQIPVVGSNDVPVSPGDDGPSSNVQSGDLPVDFGNDAVGATVSFAVMNGTPVPVTTAAGAALTYVWDAGSHTLYASTNAADAAGSAAFKLVITDPSVGDLNGSYTFTLLQALAHPHEGNSEDPNIVLSLSYTATDSNQDSTAGSVAVTIDDDMPSLDVTSTAPADALVVDDTTLGTNASANFADNFGATSGFGADGAGTLTTSFSVGISAPGADSGIDDVATGQNVLLSMNGAVVEGRTAISNELVFTVSVNSGTGVVTLDQLRAVVHNDPSDPVESGVSAATLSAANLVTVTRSSTITDRDGDSVTDAATIDIGQALRFEDDGPSVNVSATQAADTLTVDETVLATNASANFADNFSSSSAFGADGAGTLNSAYTLSTNAGSTGLVDTATLQNVVLVMNSGVVEGRTAISNALVFTVSVDAGGTVTLDQQRAVMHTPDSGPDQSTSLASASLVVLTRTDTITDKDGDSTNSSANISIGTALNFEDDGPSLTASNVAAPNVAGTYTGTYAFNVGADAQPFADSFEAGSLVWTNPRDGYELEYDAGASNATQQVYHGTFNGGADTFFDIVVKNDGTYDVTLVTPDPVNEVVVPSILSGIEGGSNLPSYTIGNEVFGGLFDLLLTGYSLGHAADTLTISATELGVGDNVMHGNKDDELRFDIQPLSGFVAVSSLTIHVATTAGWKATDTVDTIVHYTSGPDTVANVVWGADRQIVLEFDTAREVDWVEIEPNGTTAFKIDGVSLSYLTKEFPDDYSLAFQLTGDDKDGDSATAAFSVQVNTTDTSTYEIQGTAGNDHVYGTTGDDIMTGGGGNDVFVFNSMADAHDHVTDFTIGDASAGAGDALDVDDILPVEGATLASQLSGYVTLDTTTVPGSTIVMVDADGGDDGYQALVTLDGISGQTLQQLLNNHQIIT